MLTRKEFYWYLGICALLFWFYFLSALAGGLVGDNYGELFPVWIFGFPWSTSLAWILPSSDPTTIFSSIIYMIVSFIPLFINIYIFFFIIHLIIRKFRKSSSNIVH